MRAWNQGSYGGLTVTLNGSGWRFQVFLGTPVLFVARVRGESLVSALVSCRSRLSQTPSDVPVDKLMYSDSVDDFAIVY